MNKLILFSIFDRAHVTETISQKILEKCKLIDSTKNTYGLGVDKQKEIVGEEFGAKTIVTITNLSPKLAAIILEFPFGQIYQRPILDSRSREIITVASLAASGMLPQLNVHEYAALNVGLKKSELEAINLQIAVFYGMPKGINAMKELQNASAKFKTDKNLHDKDMSSTVNFRTPKEYYDFGVKKIRELYGEKLGARVMAKLYDISPEFALYTVQCLYGRVYGDETLTLKEREMVAIAALATGASYEKLEDHVYAALNVGLSEQEIREIVLQMAVYAGFYNTENAMKIVTKVFHEVNGSASK